MQPRHIIALRSGPLELFVAPRLGGSIAGFFHHGPQGRTALLRGGEEEPDSVLEAGSFPLVPFVNRVRGGRFRFRGREIVLQPTMAGDPSPLHGQGWLGAWESVESGESQCELRFVHEAGEWPWTYEARQHFRLGSDRLDLSLTCRNLSPDPMPCGLGQHPYFPCDSETVLDTGVESAWTIDDKVLPVAKVPARGRYALSRRLVCGQGLDHGFEGWSGTALISSPRLPFHIEMSSPDARFFQLYSPTTGGLFVAEPVTHRNAALNEPARDWSEAGLRVLEPGETMALAMRLRLIER